MVLKTFMKCSILFEEPFFPNFALLVLLVEDILSNNWRHQN